MQVKTNNNRRGREEGEKEGRKAGRKGLLVGWLVGWRHTEREMKRREEKIGEMKRTMHAAIFLGKWKFLCFKSRIISGFCQKSLSSYAHWWIELDLTVP